MLLTSQTHRLTPGNPTRAAMRAWTGQTYLFPRPVPTAPGYSVPHSPYLGCAAPAGAGTSLALALRGKPTNRGAAQAAAAAPAPSVHRPCAPRSQSKGGGGGAGKGVWPDGFRTHVGVTRRPNPAGLPAPEETGVRGQHCRLGPGTPELQPRFPGNSYPFLASLSLLLLSAVAYVVIPQVFFALIFYSSGMVAHREG